MRLQISGPQCCKAGSVPFLRGEREFGSTAVEPVDQSPFPAAVAHHNTEGESGRKGGRGRGR